MWNGFDNLAQVSTGVAAALLPPNGLSDAPHLDVRNTPILPPSSPNLIPMANYSFH
jgi:hypothetical protein